MIMILRRSSFAFFPVLLLLLGGAGSAACAQESASWDLVALPPSSQDQVMATPKNLARWHVGALLYRTGEKGEFIPVTNTAEYREPEAVLLLDDNATGLPLPAGLTTYVLDLADFYILSRFLFQSFGARGEVEVLTSDVLAPADAKAWVSRGASIPFQPGSRVDVRIPLEEARYLQVRLNLSTPGEIGPFGVIGLISVQQAQFVGLASSGAAVNFSQAASGTPEQPPSPATAAPAASAVTPPPTASAPAESASTSAAPAAVPQGYDPFNFAGFMYANSRIGFVSGGDPRQVNNLLDDNILTSFDLVAGLPDSQPLFVIEMDDKPSFQRITLLIDGTGGEFELYFANELPFPPDAPVIPATNVAFWADPETNLPLQFAAANATYTTAFQLTDFSGATSIRLQDDFFSNLGPPVRKTVEPGQNRLVIDVSNQTARFVVVRWNSPAGAGGPTRLRIYEVAVMGMVESRERLVRIDYNPEAMSDTLFAASNLESGLAPPPSAPPTEIAPPPAPPPGIPVVSQ